MVASPSGNVSTKSQRAAIAARSTSLSVAFGRPYRIFSRIERWNSEMSCGTTEIAWRRLCCVTLEMSWPSIVIPERNVVEGDGRATLYQRLGLRMVAQLMRKQQCGNRLGQAGKMLGDIDQRHGEI